MHFGLSLPLDERREVQETSLLRRLQAQTLPDATPPIATIYPFIKMTVLFEALVQFLCPSGFRKF